MNTTNDITTATYEVPEQNLYRLKAALDKLVRKAAKLGVGTIEYTVGAGKDVIINQREVGTTDEYGFEIKAVYVRYCPVTITGTTPRLAGWTFVATLEHAGEAGNILRSIPGVSLPVEFRTVGPTCNHCKVQRRRIDTFVVRSDSGEYLQIGRNCVQDFVGGRDPHDVTKMAEFLRAAGELGEAGEEEYFGGGHGHVIRSHTETFLQYAAAFIRLEGFVSRSAARESFEPKQATADIVWQHMHPSHTEANTSSYKKALTFYAPTEADKKTAEATLNWVEGLKGQQDLNDYLFNLTVVLSGETVDSRATGLAAAAVSSYLREVGRAAELAARQAAYANSVHVGEVGKRTEFDVTVTGVISRDSDWGTTHITKLVTKEGNALTWFQSNGTPLEIGASFRISATVKKHDDYKGSKQTIVTRCTVWTEEGIKAAEEKAAKKLAREAKKAAKAAKASKEAQ